MKYVALIPFGYYVVTRLNTRREFLYVVATQWIPGIWLVHRLGEVELPTAAGLYALGYLAFISIYEIGYFANDTWDAAQRDNARHRFGAQFGVAYILAFLVGHVGTWAAITAGLGFLDSAAWLVGYAVLAVLMAIYNSGLSDEMRLSTFVQMTYMRYMMPIVFFVSSTYGLLVAVLASLLYVYFRFLSYLDAKGFLNMPARKADSFGLIQTLMLLPLIAFFSFYTGVTVIFEVYAIYFFAYAASYVGRVARPA